MRLVVPALSLGLALTLAGPERAEACGGCFVPPEENTQVTGHRMILSISQTQTTLYDQIEYDGNPESFAWVLPIQGQVDVGLSSDTLFAFLGQNTQNNVWAPPFTCPGPPDGCYNDGPLAAGGSTGGGGGGGGGGESPPPVNVISQEVVGPYETVQLSSTDPKALRDWLESRGYNLPADIEPTIDAYVNEGFAFLAMKLVPGQDVTAMRPVRITAPGAGLAMPLRMVAAGTGDYTPITLFVVAEGRYAPANFPAYEVDRSKVGYSSQTWTSNLDDLEAAGREQFGENAWLTKSAFAQPAWAFTSQVEQVVYNLPEQSGYGNPTTGEGAVEEFSDDVAALFGGMDPDATWFTRLYANLPRQSLGQDLFLSATAQEPLPASFQAAYWLDGPPPCPDYSWCSTIDTSDVGLGGGATCAASPRAPRELGTAAFMAAAALAWGVRRGRARRR
jgi:hypothetical protein